MVLYPICFISLTIRPIASSAKSPEALFHSLTSHGLPNTPDAQKFVTDVFAQAPRTHKSKKTKDASHKPEGNKELLAKKFTLLLEEDVPTESKSRKSKTKPNEEPTEKSRKKDEKKDRHSRKREADGDQWESDEEDKAFKRRRTEEVSPARPNSS